MHFYPCDVEAVLQTFWNGFAEGSEMKRRRQSNYGADLLCLRDFMTTCEDFTGLEKAQRRF